MLRTWDRKIVITVWAVISAFMYLQGCVPTDDLPRRIVIEPFAINYAKVGPSDIEPYKLVIIEPDSYTKREIDSLKESGTKVIGYLSLGEVGPYRWYYPLLEERGFLGKNENWGSFYINLADPISTKILLQKVLPEIMIKGFDGIFLDTVDSVAPYTDRKRMAPDMLNIIRKIDEIYPGAFVIQNAGLFMLDKTAPYIDAVLVEDVATLYDFKDDSYNLRSDKSYRRQVKRIRKHAEQSGKPFMIVDFGVEKELINKIQQRLDTLNTPYFISNIEFDRFLQHE